MRLQAMAVFGGKFSGLGTNDPTGAVTNIRECDLCSEASSAPPPSTCTPHEAGCGAPRHLPPKHRVHFSSQGGPAQAATVKIISGLPMTFRPQGSLWGVGGLGAVLKKADS